MRSQHVYNTKLSSQQQQQQNKNNINNNTANYSNHIRNSNLASSSILLLNNSNSLREDVGNIRENQENLHKQDKQIGGQGVGQGRNNVYLFNSPKSNISRLQNINSSQLPSFMTNQSHPSLYGSPTMHKSYIYTQASPTQPPSSSSPSTYLCTSSQIAYNQHILAIQKQYKSLIHNYELKIKNIQRQYKRCKIQMENKIKILYKEKIYWQNLVVNCQDIQYRSNNIQKQQDIGKSRYKINASRDKDQDKLIKIEDLYLYTNVQYNDRNKQYQQVKPLKNLASSISSISQNTITISSISQNTTNSQLVPQLNPNNSKKNQNSSQSFQQDITKNYENILQNQLIKLHNLIQTQQKQIQRIQQQNMMLIKDRYKIQNQNNGLRKKVHQYLKIIYKLQSQAKEIKDFREGRDVKLANEGKLNCRGQDKVINQNGMVKYYITSSQQQVSTLKIHSEQYINHNNPSPKKRKSSNSDKHNSHTSIYFTSSSYYSCSSQNCKQSLQSDTQQLKKSDQRYQLLINSLSQQIIFQKLQKLNQKYENIYGSSLTSYTGININNSNINNSYRYKNISYSNISNNNNINNSSMNVTNLVNNPSILTNTNTNLDNNLGIFNNVMTNSRYSSTNNTNNIYNEYIIN